jgi:hypothetical protein
MTAITSGSAESRRSGTRYRSGFCRNPPNAPDGRDWQEFDFLEKLALVLGVRNRKVPPEARRRRLLETWKAVSKVFIMAVMLDCVYQLLVLRWIYPVESIVTATILAIIPYVVLRGVTDRIARTRIRPQGEVSQ